MAGISKHEPTSLTKLSGNASAGYSTSFRCNCHLNLIGFLNSSIFQRLAPLILASKAAATNDSSFPHLLTPVATSSPGTPFSNNSTNLAIIIASVAAASLFLLTVITLLVLKWRRQSIFRLDGAQDFEALLTTEPAAPPLIPSAILQQTTNNPAAYPSANKNLFGVGERAKEGSQVLGPRRTL